MNLVFGVSDTVNYAIGGGGLLGAAFVLAPTVRYFLAWVDRQREIARIERAETRKNDLAVMERLAAVQADTVKAVVEGKNATVTLTDRMTELTREVRFMAQHVPLPPPPVTPSDSL